MRRIDKYLYNQDSFFIHFPEDDEIIYDLRYRMQDFFLDYGLEVTGNKRIQVLDDKVIQSPKAIKRSITIISPLPGSGIKSISTNNVLPGTLTGYKTNLLKGDLKRDLIEVFKDSNVEHLKEIRNYEIWFGRYKI